jgi:MFS family permease
MGANDGCGGGGGGGSLRALLKTKNYPALFFCGWVGNTAKEGAVFAVSHLIQQLTHSTRLVELVGAANFAALALGPICGWISDRFKRRSVVLVSKCVAVPASLLIASCMSLTQRGRLSSTAMLALGYLYTFIMGATFVIDQTCRKVLVSDTVAPPLLPTAFAMESVASALSTLFGSQLGGFAIEYLGGHGAYLRMLACFHVLSGLLAFSVRSSTSTNAAAKLSAAVGIVQQLREGVDELRRNRAFQSILGVTIIGNFWFVGPFFPVVHVLAANLGLSPTLTGSLASARGYGGALAGLMLLATAPKRVGVVYWLGIALSSAVMPVRKRSFN